MTFKEMIFKGLCDGTVKIISNPNIHCVQEKIFKIYILIERKEYGGYQRIKRKIYE